MKKRAIVGGFHHESDTFNPIVTGRKDIFIVRGEEMLKSKSKSSYCGIIKALQAEGIEPVPTLVARAVPNGEWDREYYLELKEEFLAMVKAAEPFDIFALALHGSMRVKDLGEAEGDLLETLKGLYPDKLIVTSLDMHATLTRRMMENADAFVGYKCAPHTDTYETGLLAGKIAAHALKTGRAPKMAAVHVPFIVAGEQSETSVEPMKSLTDSLRAEEKGSVLACSYLMGFPWADTEENGVSALVVTDGDETLAKSKSRELATLFWARRKEFCFYNETAMPEEALKRARKSIEEGVYPVVISDSGDNPTAGSSQDVTNFLKLILKDDYLKNLDPPFVYQGFYDPEIAEAAKNAGVGGKVKGLLGAKFDKVKSSPVEIDATVKALGSYGSLYKSDLALLDVEGVDVVVTSAHVGCYDPEMMRALDIEPEKCKAIVVKLGYLEPEIRAIAKRSLMALTTGSSDELFERLPYRKMKRPVYPLDGDFEPDLFFV
jgi:Uncharacterized conserved protein